jgi:hypothetical protein
VSRRARTRAAGAALMLFVAGAVLAFGQLSGTFALFTTDTENQNSVFAGDWVEAPSGLGTPTVSGLGASLSWTAGTHGVTGQEIWYADNTTTTNCTGVTYAGLVTGASLSATTNSIGATGSPNDAVPSGDNGDNICYQIRSTHNAWYTVANFAVIQVGLVPLTIAFSGTGSGNMLTNNIFTVTFNQSFTYSSGNINVTATAGNPGTVSLGALGTISGGNITRGGTCTGSTVGGTGTSTMTITLKSCPNTGTTKIVVTAGGTGTYTGAGSSVVSSTGSVSQCTKSNCQRTFTW